MPITDPLASIIIATRNKATYLELTLASLERQTIPLDRWEVIITDDASEDFTARVLQTYTSRGRLQIRWQTAGQQRGRSGARNDALALASGKTIVFLDDDRIVGPDFLFWHLAHQTRLPQIVMGEIHSYIHSHVGPNIDSRMWDITSAIAQHITGRGIEPGSRILLPDELDVKGRVQSLTESPLADWAGALRLFDEHSVPYPPAWIYFTTGNASAPRKTVESIGGFDEGFTGWGLEDNDVCLRLMKAGLNACYEVRALTLHQKHPRGANQFEEYRRNFERFRSLHPDECTADACLQCGGVINVHQWINLHKKKQISGSLNVRSNEFSGETVKTILWCVPGEHAGCARRAIVLCRELLHACQSLRIVFVSGGSSAQYLRSHAFPVKDIGGSGASLPQARYDAYVDAIREFQPDLVVSDEELLMLPISYHHHKNCVYISSSLASEQDLPEASYYSYAKRILFPDIDGSVEIPSNCFASVDFCGPWIAPIDKETQIEEKKQWHSLLSKEGQKKLVLIALSEGTAEDAGWAVTAAEALTKQGSAEFDVVLLAGKHKPLLDTFAERLGSVRVYDELPGSISPLFAADVVIAPAEHTLLWELAAAAVPAVIVPIYNASSERIVRRMSRLAPFIAQWKPDQEAMVLQNTVTRLLGERNAVTSMDIPAAASTGVQNGVREIMRWLP